MDNLVSFFLLSTPDPSSFVSFLTLVIFARMHYKENQEIDNETRLQLMDDNNSEDWVDGATRPPRALVSNHFLRHSFETNDTDT